MNSLSVNAPAKINLILEVRRRRPDGYHELRTVMHALELADQLTIRSDRRLRVTCDHPAVPSGEKNLVHRAVEGLARLAGVEPRLHVHIRKRIPVAAGLGGGSSDAAAALRVLSRLWKVDDRKALHRLARGLGSDVPFFLQGGCALGTGRGDRLFPWPSASGLPVVLVNPGFPVSTAWVYGHLNLRLTRKKACISMLRLALFRKNLIKISQNLFNHLEPVTAARHPVIVRMEKDLLAAGAAGVCMSGSGPTVFGLAHTEAQAADIQRLLADRYPCVVRTRLAGATPAAEPAGKG